MVKKEKEKKNSNDIDERPSIDAFDKDLAAIRFNEELGMQVDTSH